jgi:hypothetical protein
MKRTSRVQQIEKIRGVTWQWKANARRQRKVPGASDAGVIAQEVEASMPDLIVMRNGVKHVRYTGLVGVLVEAVKELKLAHDELADRVATLERERKKRSASSPRQSRRRRGTTTPRSSAVRTASS